MQFIKNVTGGCGNSIAIVLDMDADTGRGVVRFYDARFTGTGPRGSVGQGFTVDGQFISELSPSSVLGHGRGFTLDLHSSIPAWCIPAAGVTEMNGWIVACHKASTRDIPKP